MPEIPTAHPGAPLTVWLRASDATGHYYQTLYRDEPDAVEYVRKDVAEPAIRAALEALEDDDPTGATAILRTCLSRL